MTFSVRSLNKVFAWPTTWVLPDLRTKIEISDVYEMENLTEILYDSLYHFYPENLSAFDVPLFFVKGVFSLAWYLTKGFLWVLCSPVLAVKYYFENYIEGLYWILITLLSFVQVKLSFNSYGDGWSLWIPKAVKSFLALNKICFWTPSFNFKQIA